MILACVSLNLSNIVYVMALVIRVTNAERPLKDLAILVLVLDPSVIFINKNFEYQRHQILTYKSYYNYFVINSLQ